MLSALSLPRLPIMPRLQLHALLLQVLDDLQAIARAAEVALQRVCKQAVGRWWMLATAWVRIHWPREAAALNYCMLLHRWPATLKTQWSCRQTQYRRIPFPAHTLSHLVIPSMKASELEEV